MSSDEDIELPSDIEEAVAVINGLVPEKSREKYHMAYQRYEKWCKDKKIKDLTNEKALLVYFEELSKVQKPSSLWCYYSMLRTELSVKKNVNIKKYTNLIALLKRKSEGYKSKKSRVLTKENIVRFLQNADDRRFLLMKVLLIFGLAGGCRREELTYLLRENVKEEGECIRVLIPTTKTKISREFFITCGNFDGLNLVEIVKQYLKLRPEHCDINRFFLSYKNGKCTKQPIGINTVGKIPKLIAEFLELPHANEYTGHCFRRSSATLLADAGVDLLTVKRHGGWKSNSVAETYIEDSSENKKRTSMKILGEKDVPSTFKQVNVVSETSIKSNQSLTSQSSTSGVSLNNCKDCIVNIYNK